MEPSQKGNSRKRTKSPLRNILIFMAINALTVYLIGKSFGLNSELPYEIPGVLSLLLSVSSIIRGRYERLYRSVFFVVGAGLTCKAVYISFF